MIIKKLGASIIAVALTFSLSGCMGSTTTKLPEGDVKIVNQEVQGVVDLLLQSANYGDGKSIVNSMILPEGSQYQLNLILENYNDGNLIKETEIANYETDNIEKDSIINIIINSAKLNDDKEDTSIYSFAEIDRENTTDSKNPNYKISKYYGEAISYDKINTISQIGKSLEEEIPLVAFIKYKDGNSEVKDINLDTYKDEVSNYSEVSVVKLKVSKK